MCIKQVCGKVQFMVACAQILFYRIVSLDYGIAYPRGTAQCTPRVHFLKKEETCVC